MKQLERRLGNLEKRTGSKLIVLKVVEDRGQSVQVEDRDNLSREDIHAATERYRREHPDDRGSHGILVLYFDRDENGVVRAIK
ncbi:hypothetical protein ACFLXE_06705 [Chloroflexota bacterium]